MSNARRFTLQQELITRGCDPETAQATDKEAKRLIQTGEKTVTEVCEEFGLSQWFAYDLKGSDFPEGQYLQATTR